MSNKHWESAAKQYSYCVRQGRDECRAIYEPAVWELLAGLSGVRVLDAGCGEGYWSRKLAESGATVIGIDASAELVRLAKATNVGIARDPQYLVAELLEPLPFPDRSVDLVLASMVLMDIPRIDTAVSEFSRVLVPGGTFVFSITHPCFFMADWKRDDSGHRSHKVLADYLHGVQEAVFFLGRADHPLSSSTFGVLQRTGVGESGGGIIP